MSRQSAGKRRAEITHRRKGKKPDKSKWGRSSHRRLFGETRVPLDPDSFLMAAGDKSVCGQKGTNHVMVRSPQGGYVCKNPGCPANC